ncbi:flagellar basal body rod C-terminal domain-containing protein [Desulfovibrio inopinatus]|uniref:flagellar basal body rod C-terminal domain-containing protein n=1 Tax=Desulfovibrio inopinatus TaxID=102109 RepID=UPI00041A4DF8|nr:flagellar basal body rod C-terminal domain-containing protein [Desulfovibrio inopinatus]
MSNANVNALGAYSEMASVAAHNIANMSTPSFTPSRVALESMLDPNGVRAIDNARLENATPPQEITAERARLESSTGAHPSDVDVAREMVNLTVAENGFAANAQAVRVQDDMTRQVIDMVT